MSFSTCIASLVIDFSFRTFGFFQDFWTWKLDTFRVRKTGNYDVTISHSDGSILRDWKTETFPLLEEERSGFFLRRIRKLPDDRLLYQLIRASSEECILAFCVNADWSHIDILEDKTESGGSAAFEYLSKIMPGIFLNHHILTFHSALVEHNGHAYALCADSGVGKTTRARLWRDHKNALILNGDRTVCKRYSEGWTAYGTPWSGSSGEQINRSAPLRALVILQRAAEKGHEDDRTTVSENTVFTDGVNSVRRLTPAEAFPRLLPHMLYPAWDEELVNNAFTELDLLLQELPVLLFRSRPEPEAIDLLEKALEELR